MGNPGGGDRGKDVNARLKKGNDGATGGNGNQVIYKQQALKREENMKLGRFFMKAWGG